MLNLSDSGIQNTLRNSTTSQYNVDSNLVRTINSNLYGTKKYILENNRWKHNFTVRLKLFDKGKDCVY